MRVAFIGCVEFSYSCLENVLSNEHAEVVGIVTRTGSALNNDFRSLVPLSEKTGIPVYSIAGIKEVVQYLYKEKIPVLIQGSKKPIDDKTKALFDKYLEVYGN